MLKRKSKCYKYLFGRLVENRRHPSELIISYCDVFCNNFEQMLYTMNFKFKNRRTRKSWWILVYCLYCWFWSWKDWNISKKRIFYSSILFEMKLLINFFNPNFLSQFNLFHMTLFETPEKYLVKKIGINWLSVWLMINIT